MIEKHLKLKTMNTITRDYMADSLCSLPFVELMITEASGSGTTWEFLSFETELDDDDNYHWVDVWSNQDGSYVVSFLHLNIEDDRFMNDNTITRVCYSLEEIINFIQSQF